MKKRSAELRVMAFSTALEPQGMNGISVIGGIVIYIAKEYVFTVIYILCTSNFI